MSRVVIVDPFHRALAAKLQALIDDAVDSLSNGSAARNSEEAASTSEKYAAQVAQIQTLRNVMALCDLVGEEIIRPAKVEVKER